jgi:flagellar motor switch protein FliM
MSVSQSLFGEISSRRAIGVKGKPFDVKQTSQFTTDVQGYSLRKPLASQISKIDWQSEKLTSEQWRFLNRVLGQFAELLPSSLTPLLQLRAIVEPAESEIKSFGIFLEPFSDPTPYCLFSPNEKSKGLWVMETPLAFSMLDCLMGGKGEPLDDLREFTDLEKVLFQRQILPHFLSTYAEAWNHVTALNPKIEQIEFSSNRLLVFTFSEMLVTASFSLRLGSSQGMFYLAIPLKHVRDVIPKNPDAYTQSILRKAEENQPTLGINVGKKIEAAPVLLSVELGQADVPFQDLLGLEEGDILRLNTLRTESLKIKVSGKTKFLGKPGSLDNKVAVQITHVLQEGDEFYEE